MQFLDDMYKIGNLRSIIYSGISLLTLTIHFIVRCCPSVLLSASTWSMGQFKFYKIGSNGRTIYQNSGKHYIYLARDGYWKASERLINIHA